MGLGGLLAPLLFWLIKLLFQFFSKVLHKNVHRVILCQTCGPQRKHCFFLITPFRSNIVFWRFSWCLSRQFAEFLVRSRRLDFRLPNNEFQAPVYSAAGERSFSSARRLKTWLRSTMTQTRFSNLTILNTHKQRTDNLCLIDIANEFTALNNNRRKNFGTFKESDFKISG